MKTEVSMANFRHGIVRDLAWLARSPDIMTLPESLCADWLFDINNLQQRLETLDNHPESVISQLRQQACYRLGYYFEDLVKIYLKQFIQPTEIKTNIQVFKDKTTVGEYDFLIRLNNGKKVHLETAVKFYLCTDTRAQDLSHFIGPNRSDQLSRKWQRLNEHQLQLSSTLAGSRQAEKLDLFPDVHSLLLKGYLFYPYAEWQDANNWIEPISPQHARGWWLPLKTAQELPANQDFRYGILMKPQWLAPARMCFQDSLSRHELLTNIDDLSSPLLIAQLNEHPEHGWQEVSRGFIVPDDWHQKA